MSLRLTIAILSCVSFSACATINLDEMAVSSKSPVISGFDVNVVQRATEKLFSAFSNKGLVAKDSQKRMQSAARILLKGLEEKDVLIDQASYQSNVSDPLIVLADIKTVSRHVEQTTKAAEVYLAMAPIEKSVKKELGSLEQALLASRSAEAIFETTLLDLGQNSSASEFVNYKQVVDELKYVTDAFGERVRDDFFKRTAQIN